MKEDYKLVEDIRIELNDNDTKIKLGKSLHCLLKGHEDYIENRIILNVDEINTVRIWIFDDCRNQELVKQLKKLAESQR